MTVSCVNFLTQKYKATDLLNYHKRDFGSYFQLNITPVDLSADGNNQGQMEEVNIFRIQIQ